MSKLEEGNTSESIELQLTRLSLEVFFDQCPQSLFDQRLKSKQKYKKIQKVAGSLRLFLFQYDGSLYYEFVIMTCFS